jgi:NADPH-dependent 7-cyano-7-deazaguanine reductase QueF-like protein
MKTTLRLSFIALLSSLLVACGGGGGGGCSAALGLLPGAGCNSSPNTVPVANAGVTQNVTTGSLVTLDGSASRDANNESLTYLWQFISVPSGSLAALSSATSVKPTFTADVTGTYTLSLLVNDGKANSLAATVNVYASVNNSAPVANAGVNQSVAIGASVTLDGTASSDANRDPITYKWALISKPTGSTAELNSAISPNPKFTADIAGAYVAILTVNDGKADSTASPVTVTASGANSAPVANAGVAQNVALNATVTLDGTGSSDANNDFITYKWVLITKPTGSTATLSSATSAKPTFKADVAGTFVASLIVNDGKVDSTAAAVPITVASANSEPIANAGINQNVVVGASVTLDGTNSSDANRDQLTFRWVMMSKPTGSAASLSSAVSAKPVFVADTVGTYVISLIVNDGKVDSTAVSTTVTASTANAAPVANAGTNQNVTHGTVTLDGSNSSDANYDPLTFTWTLLNKPTGSSAALSSSTSAKPTFNADVAGIYVFGLVVNDGKVNSAAVTVSITAASANVAPVANAGTNQNVVLGAVTLDGSTSSDANNDSLTYKWTLLSKPTGSNASLANATTAKPAFIADVAGVYVASLIVNDGKVDSAISSTTITAAAANVAPVANAGSIQSVVLGTVTLDGSASTDANGDTLTYKWTLLAKPIASTATLSSTTSAKPTFTADLTGVYVASLIVNDGKADSAVVTVTVNASQANVAPVANAGAFQNVVAGQLVSLDGTASSDANRDLLTYKWVLISKPVGSNAGLSSTTSSRPTFTADLIGTYVLSLQVNDGKLSSELSYVSITATVANSVPVANAGAAQAVTVGATVTLNALGSTDANGDVLLYKWVMTYIPPGSNATLSSLIVAQPTFIADVAGVYVASLIVNDGKADSTVSTVAVTATAP